MRVSGRIVGANIDFKTNKPMLMLEINERNDFDITYDEKWIKEVYLPKLTYLAECLREGRFP